MAISRFYIESLRPGISRLSPSESVHAAKSKRLSVGDSVTVFDGMGQEGSGRIIELSKKGVEVKIDQVNLVSRPKPVLEIAVALPKGSRQDVLIEKCTELAVAAIHPIGSERSVSSATEHKLDKWRRKTIEAAKQSKQCWLPEIHEIRPLASLYSGFKDYDRVLLTTAAGDRLPDNDYVISIIDLLANLGNLDTILGLVGPEGGWASEEMQALIAAGVQPVTLGPCTLRIETAAITLAAMIHALH